MSFKLKLLLFYINNILKIGGYGDTPPSEVRAENKKRSEKLDRIIDYPPVELHHIEDRKISMRDGVSIPIRIYHPSDKKNLPIIVFFHGGGFVLRNIDSHDTLCRRTAKKNEAIVVSVGYRLAPEAKFPTGPHDCYDATLWVSQNTSALGGDPDKLIVMGDSAGGNLATVTAIQARDLGMPKITKQVLIYPAVDARLQHPSVAKYGKGYFLTEEMTHWFVDHYKSKEEDIFDPLMSPLLNKDLSNLPPAFVAVAGLDPLQDEGEAYAKKLELAANEVVFKKYEGVVHAFANMPKIMKKAFQLDEDVRSFIESD